MTSYADWIPEYPDVTDPAVSLLLAQKSELIAAQGQISEKILHRGDLYKHQIAFQRMLTYYDRCLLINEPGTGKTCAIIALCEYYKKNKSHIKRVYVLEKGPPTKADFLNQIIYKCTDGNYEKIAAYSTAEERFKATKKKVKEWYNIMTYKKFTDLVDTNNDDEIHAAFDDSIIYIDEGHNLRNDRKVKESDENGDMNILYQKLHKITHTVNRSKVIIGTATPMINQVQEVIRLLNLINTEDQQLPLDWNYDLISLSQIEPYLRGKISYVRVLDTGVRKFQVGEPIKASYDIQLPAVEVTSPITDGPQPLVEVVTKTFESQTIIERCYMSDFQKKVYDRAVASNDNSSSFDESTKQASIFVYPDGSYGSAGFKKYVTEDKGKYALDPELARQLKRDEKLQEYSCKIYQIVMREWFISHLRGLVSGNEKYVTFDITYKQFYYLYVILEFGFVSGQIDGTKYDDYNIFCQDVAENTDKDYVITVDRLNIYERIGNAFCYSDNYVNGGAVLIGLILELHGFKKYNVQKSAFADGRLKSEIDRRPRYAILTSNQDSLNASTIELFNSYENRHGDYIQIIIGTPTSRDGINLFNCLRGYLLKPDWHPSGMQQALARILRSMSQDSLIDEIKKRHGTRETGLEVEIYRLAAVWDNYEMGSDDPNDIRIYKIAEEKDLRIRRMMRFMKICAMDCLIHYNRNVRSTDIDMSDVCDYDICHYTCSGAKKPGGIAVNVPKEDHDPDNFDIIFSGSIIRDCQKYIVEFATDHPIFTFDMLTATISETPSRYVLEALYNIIQNKKAIYDRFGFKSYLANVGSTFFLTKDFILGRATVVPAAYQLDIIVKDKEDSTELVQEFKEISTNNTIREMQSLAEALTIEHDDNKIDILNERFRVLFFDELSLEDRTEISEQIIVKKLMGETPSVFDEIIMKHIGFFIYKCNYPSRSLQDLMTQASTARKSSVGRPSKTKKFDVDDDLIDSDMKTEGEKVFVHYISVTRREDASYGLIPRIRSPITATGCNIRILVLKEKKGWRDVTLVENIVYKTIITKMINAKFQSYSPFPYYAILLHTNLLSVVNQIGQKSDSTADNRRRNDGRNCTSTEKVVLLDFMDYLYTQFSFKAKDFLKGPADSLSENGKFRTELRSLDKFKKFTDDQIANRLLWDKCTRDILCMYIRQCLEKNPSLLLRIIEK